MADAVAEASAGTLLAWAELYGLVDAAIQRWTDAAAAGDDMMFGFLLEGERRAPDSVQTENT